VATLHINQGRIHVDLTGCEAQRPSPTNATFSQTYSGVVYVLKCLIDPEIPVNDGFYRLVDIRTRPGSVVSARHPAAVDAGWEVAIYETLAGGYGATLRNDGMDAVQAHFQNTENAPVEETEANYPVRILRYELIDDSEGAGQYRGGLGVRRDYTFPGHAPSFSILSDKARYAPWGLFGGGAARPAQYILNPDTEARALPSKITLPLQPGDVISVQTPGGGGCAPVWQRPPALVAADVAAGKISLARAREVYGVVVHPDTYTVDEAATTILRAGMARS
jgi:N-methylhydantoinase B